jgi:hypothetical protein
MACFTLVPQHLPERLRAPRQTPFARTVSVVYALIRNVELPFAEYEAVVQTAVIRISRRKKHG